MNSCQKYLATCLLTMFAPAVFAQVPDLGDASAFAVLGAAVTTTGSNVTGNVGSSGAVTLTDSSIRGNLVYSGALTNTTSTISGTSTQPLPAQVVTDFNSAYTALGLRCTQTIPEAAFTGVPLSVGSGVICFPAAVTFTDSVLTLTGNGPWIFRVGTAAAGALTGKNLTVVMGSGGDACDVFWQVNAAATMTTSVFQGNILAGAAITTTGGTFAGRALATAGVTMTNTIVTGCDALPGAPSCKGKKHHKRHHHKGHKGDHGHDKGDNDHGDDEHDDNDHNKGRGPHPMKK